MKKSTYLELIPGRGGRVDFWVSEVDPEIARKNLAPTIRTVGEYDFVDSVQVTVNDGGEVLLTIVLKMDDLPTERHALLGWVMAEEVLRTRHLARTGK